MQPHMVFMKWQSCLGAAPQAKPLYDAVVNALNAKCKNNK